MNETVENWIETIRVIRNFVKTQRTEDQIVEFFNSLMGQNQRTLTNDIAIMVQHTKAANDG
ncbi:hypothetical protein K1X76_01995 [bacterium]|nr:hypothetical protein [bacterium]